MGCDIHVHTEVKINGEWHHLGNPSVSRDYALFSKMAGVRQCDPEIKPIAEPRGVPEDATFLTKFDFEKWEGDAHSSSWLSSEEIDELGEWYSSMYASDSNLGWIEQEFGYLFGNGWDIKKYPNDYPPGVEDARWIFWFDN